MNLALLDPFRRQLPDRIDCTLSLPRALHYRPPPPPSLGESYAGGGKPKRSRQQQQHGGAGGDSSLDQQSSKAQSSDRSTDNVSVGGGGGDAPAVLGKENLKDGGASHQVDVKEDEDEDEASQFSKQRKNTSTSASSDRNNKKSSGEANSTVSLSDVLDDEHELLPCLRVSFNRRGTYLAVGHGSGTVAVWDYLSRTLVGLYPPTTVPLLDDKDDNDTYLIGGGKVGSDGQRKRREKVDKTTLIDEDQVVRSRYVTSLSWSRRGRTLLIHSRGDVFVKRVDVSAPNPDYYILKEQKFSGSNGPAGGGSSSGGDGGGGASGDGSADAAAAAVAAASAGIMEHVATIVNSDGTIVPGGILGGSGRTSSSSTITTKSSGKKGNSGSGEGAGDEAWDGPGVTVLFPIKKVSNQSDDTSWAAALSETEACTNPGGSKSRKKQRFDDVPRQQTGRGSKKAKSRRGAHVSGQLLRLPSPTSNIMGCQLLPRDDSTGLACLADGSLVLFHFPPWNCLEREEEQSSVDNGQTRWKWQRRQQDDDGNTMSFEGKIMYIVPPGGYVSPKAAAKAASRIPLKRGSAARRNGDFISCATFDQDGSYIYAITMRGVILGFRVLRIATDDGDDASSGEIRDKGPYIVRRVFECATKGDPDSSETTADASGGGGGSKASEDGLEGTTHEIHCSRHGSLILVNNLRGGMLMLYDTKRFNEKLTASPTSMDLSSVPPRHVFTDPVNPSKTIFYTSDFSGDGEYIVGGCNSQPQPGDKYELYIWSATTGELLDRLTGPQAIMYSVSWHPTRSFIAAGTSDGLVDVWGPRMDWTAFAPDFQALPMNVEYVEREDEFDVVVDGRDVEVERRKREEMEDIRREREDVVDVVNVERVPVFASDSEGEDEVFSFRTRVVKGFISVGRGRAAAK